MTEHCKLEFQNFEMISDPHKENFLIRDMS